MSSERPETAPPEPLAERVRAGDRRALARAITLVESTRSQDRPRAEALLSALLPYAGQAIRIGIAGPPGVGKSTLIDSLGLHLVSHGRRLAVLAVDPSSPVSGGSILGDKTRMTELARSPAAFIRPSPTGGRTGGVARRTPDAVTLCEAAGFDTVVVETVGLGQSDTAVADMVDILLLLVAPGGGDSLQGIKRGIMERADLVLVTKADGGQVEEAMRTAAEYRHALHLLRPAAAGWEPTALTCSALTGTGIAELWQAIDRFRLALGGEGVARRRAAQILALLKEEVGEELKLRLAGAGWADRAAGLESEVVSGRLTLRAAARRIVGELVTAAKKPSDA
jgi:GTPase